MKITKQVISDIEKAKKKLLKQLQKGLICENFGQDEIIKIRDKYNLFSLENYNTDERNFCLTIVNQFIDWCGNATIS